MKYSKLQHSLKALRNNVNNKFDSKDRGIKLSKFVKTPLNFTLRYVLVKKPLLTLLILILRNDIELFPSISDVYLIL